MRRSSATSSRLDLSERAQAWVATTQARSYDIAGLRQAHAGSGLAIGALEVSDRASR